MLCYHVILTSKLIVPEPSVSIMPINCSRSEPETDKPKASQTPPSSCAEILPEPSLSKSVKQFLSSSKKEIIIQLNPLLNDFFSSYSI